MIEYHPRLRAIATAKGMRGMGQAMEKMSESYSGWRAAIWSAADRRPPPVVADPEMLAATLQRAVADTADEVCHPAARLTLSSRNLPTQDPPSSGQ